MQNLSPDFLQFWTAAELLASGRSPYDAMEQARVQRQLGWDKARQGLGAYDFLPYYYPPWLGLACIAFLPLGFETAKIAWLVLNVELLLLGGWLLGPLLRGVPRWISVAVAPLFLFSLWGALIGQITPLMVLLIILAWRFLDRGADRRAGWALALLMTKPQLGIVLVFAIVVWAARQRRWRVIEGLVTALAGLCLVSFLTVPDWPWQIRQALEQTPLVTAASPWLGTTWWAVPQTVGLRGYLLWGAYLVVAGPCLVVIFKVAWNRRSSAGAVIGGALVGTFVVVPYARVYDLSVLVVPLLMLLPGRLDQRRTAAVFLACVLFPFGQLYWVPPSDPYRHEVAFFWVPALLAVAWLAQGRECQQMAALGKDSTQPSVNRI
jgi:hypothetical protein